MKSRMLNNIKMSMERNRYMIPLSLWLKESGIVSACHTVEYSIKRKYMRAEYDQFILYYKKYEKEFAEVCTIVADEKSKKVYKAVIEVRSGRNIFALKKLMDFPQYFPKDIIKNEYFKDDGCFVDGGGYSGDTVLEFIKHSNYKYKCIYTWEPDPQNLKYLRKNIESLKNVKVIERGMWSKCTTLTFSSNGNDKSRVGENGKDSIQVDSIDNVCAQDKVTFIKMDIEGSEQMALEGARKVIEQNRPIMAICIYHSCEDFWKIPMWIKENTKDYSLYIRAHSDTGYEVVAYGIPRELEL